MTYRKACMILAKDYILNNGGAPEYLHEKVSLRVHEDDATKAIEVFEKSFEDLDFWRYETRDEQNTNVFQDEAELLATALLEDDINGTWYPDDFRCKRFDKMKRGDLHAAKCHVCAYLALGFEE